MSIKNKFIGTPSDEPTAVYFNTQQGKKQIPLLGMCFAVDVEYNEWNDTHEVKTEDTWVGKVQRDSMSKLLGIRVIAAKGARTAAP